MSLTWPETQTTPRPHVRGKVVSTVDLGGTLRMKRSLPLRQDNPLRETQQCHRAPNKRSRLCLESNTSSSLVCRIAQPQWPGRVAKTSLDRYGNTEDEAILEPKLLRILDECCTFRASFDPSHDGLPDWLEDCCKAAVDKIQRIRLPRNEGYNVCIGSTVELHHHMNEGGLELSKNHLKIISSI